jgi:dTDP-4-amino-4,6-dideoxygalactose transaminase
VTVPFLDLSRGVEAMRTELDAAVARVLDSGAFVLGPVLAEFEAAFADYCGASHAVGVASGTDALTIALQAVGVEPGDEVITAANTCVPTIAAIEAAGAVPVLADVDADTLTLDHRALADSCTARTRAIVPVHLYGQCADMDPIHEFARSRQLLVVEDAAQAHGAVYRGSRAGTLGRAAAFSFYPTKNLGALGDAGMVVTRDADVAERARLLRNYGERDRYESVLRGRNSRLDPLQAAVLLAKLPRLDTWVARRRELAARYLGSLQDCGLGLPVEAPGNEHAFHLFVVRTGDRDGFRASLADAGVGTLAHYPRPIHAHPAYEHLSREGSLVESEAACREVVSLPLYPELNDAEVDAVTSAVLRWVTTS